ncbi:MAG: hypothetical protein VKJ44_08810 [Synechococcus sp.]|nr:hypothetical protein [Synechococcus sp.]
MDVPEVNPSPADLQRVAVAGRRSRLQALLREPRPGNRSRPAPTADPGLRVARFDSLETGSATACHDPAICSQVMRNNMTGLHRAFAP